MTELWVIEVVEAERGGRGRFWRPLCSGYTNLLAAAGVYDEAKARSREISGRCRARPLREVVDELLADRWWLETYGLGFDRCAPSPGNVADLLGLDFRVLIVERLTAAVAGEAA